MRSRSLHALAALLIGLSAGGCKTSNGDGDSAAPSGSGSDGGASADAGGPAVYGGDAGSVSAKVGETFVVRVPSNSSTPWIWELVELPGDAPLRSDGVEQLKTPPKDCPECTGYGGADLWSFTGVKPGSVDVVLEERHVGEPGSEPRKTVRMVVTVQ